MASKKYGTHFLSWKESRRSFGIITMSFVTLYLETIYSRVQSYWHVGDRLWWQKFTLHWKECRAIGTLGTDDGEKSSPCIGKCLFRCTVQDCENNDVSTREARCNHRRMATLGNLEIMRGELTDKLKTYCQNQTPNRLSNIPLLLAQSQI